VVNPMVIQLEKLQVKLLSGVFVPTVETANEETLQLGKLLMIVKGSEQRLISESAQVWWGAPVTRGIVASRTFLLELTGLCKEGNVQ